MTIGKFTPFWTHAFSSRLEIPIALELSNWTQDWGAVIPPPSSIYVPACKLLLDYNVFSDNSCFRRLDIIAMTGDSLRPNLLLVTRDKCLYILELTVGFESNLRNNSHRKQLKYKTLIREQQKNFNNVRFVNLCMSALGVFDHLTKSFLEMLQDLKFDVTTRNFIIRRTMTIAIRTTYNMFCRRNKDWDSQELLVF